MKRVCAVLLGLALVLSASGLRASAFAAERIEVDGEVYPLLSQPLEPWLDRHPRIRRALEQPEPDVLMVCGGDMRGYRGFYAIDGGRLWVRFVRRQLCQWQDPANANMVPVWFGGRETALATWFSGILVVPVGELTQYVHMGYGSLYAEYRLFRVERGRVTDEARMDEAQYMRYRDAQFAEWKKTRDYRRQYAELFTPERAGRRTPEEAEGFLYTIDVGYTTRYMLPFEVADAPAPEVPQ